MRRTGTALRHTLTQALPTILGIIVLCFLLLHLVPGDAADVLAAENGSATAGTMIALRQRFGLDQPMFAQLISYLVQLAHLDLGFSTWLVDVTGNPFAPAFHVMTGGALSAIAILSMKEYRNAPLE